MTTMKPANMIEGTVMTAFIDEFSGKMQFTLRDDQRKYVAPLNEVRLITAPNAGVRFFFYVENGQNVARDIKYDLQLPTDREMDEALLESVRHEITTIATIHKCPKLVEACGESGPRLTELSLEAEDLLKRLDSIVTAKADPHPSNPDMLPVYRELKRIGGEFGAIMTEGKLFNVFIRDEDMAAVIADPASTKTFMKVLHVRANAIEGDRIPEERIVARKALEAFVAA